MMGLYALSTQRLDNRDGGAADTPFDLPSRRDGFLALGAPIQKWPARGFGPRRSIYRAGKRDR